MNLKKIIFCLFIISILNFNLFSQGLIPLSQQEYNKISSVKVKSEFGFATSIPEAYSMERYVPIVKKQDGNSCTGFSVYYYGLSTQYNYMLQITTPIDKIGHSFDPYFAYTIINEENFESTFECKSYNRMIDVLAVLETKGAKKQFFNPLTECYSSSELINDNLLERYTLPYSIDDYWKIPSLGLDLSVSITKRKINDNQPVLIGAWFSNNSLENVGDDGDYSPKDQELNSFMDFRSNNYPSEDEINVFKENYYGHALTIIGYDDNMYGGAFRVVNSWGEEWGDDGYFWLKYKDFKIITTEAYVLDLSLDINSTENPQFSLNDYKRINYGDQTYYEGSISNEMRNGQGIFSFDSEQGRLNAIGTWKDDQMNGFFTLINSVDEIYYGIYEDGVYVENNSFGFNDDDDDDESKKNKQKFLDYWKKYGGDKKIKKSRTIIVKPKKTI